MSTLEQTYKCGPLRVLPEVVAEMRQRAAEMVDVVRYDGTGRADMLRGTAMDLLRALDEIDKLRVELAQTREALDEAREQATHARMELLDREVEAEERRARQPPLLSPDGPLRALPVVDGPIDREMCGKLVRSIWVDWAREQPSPKPSWLVPWEGLGEPDREVDRRIGWALFDAGRESMRPAIEKLQQTEHRSPPVEWAWLDEKQRAEAWEVIRGQVESFKTLASAYEAYPETALRYEGLAASLLSLIALPEAPSPLTPEQREVLGREAFRTNVEAEGTAMEQYQAIGERLFLRGLGAGRDLLEAGQLLSRILACDDLPRADREISPGLQIAVGRIVGAVERLGDLPPDREPMRSAEPATEQERALGAAEALRLHARHLRDLGVYAGESARCESIANIIDDGGDEDEA